MTDEGQINVFKCLDFIRDNAAAYAKAKADRIFLEEFRKSKKSLLMRQAELNGHKTAATQEREAYADPEYIQLLEGLREATEAEEALRWKIEGAKLKIAVFQTLEATKRMEAKVIQ